ncbi:MAG: sulfotransferase [Planctomycetota bacterium]
MTVERLPLLYVLSNGRSGSTLVELLVGNHPRAWTVGEVQVLPHDVADAAASCGCGVPVAACSFWNTVLDGFDVVHERALLTQFRATRNHGKVLRAEHLRDLLRGRVAPSRRSRAAAYAEHSRDLLERVRTEASRRRGGPVDLVVDASKDPYRLLWLADSGLFDLRVVHLVKDPRAFVHSMVRTKERPHASEVLRLSGRWAVENLAMDRLVRGALPAENVRRVRYEDLAGDPRGTLVELGAWLGLDFPADWHEGAFRGPESHAISGNATRFRAGGVRLDERWREQSPAWVRRATWLATAPTRIALGKR